MKDLEFFPTNPDLFRYAKLLPAHEIRRVLETMVKEEGKPKCHAKLAKGHATTITRFFPQEKGDTRTYIEGLTALFTHYPEKFVEKVVHPTFGLPSKQTFLPSIAEVKRELDALAEHRTRIFTAAANNEKETRKRIERQREEMLAKETPEQRKAAVARWLEERKGHKGGSEPPVWAKPAATTQPFNPTENMVYSPLPEGWSSDDLRAPARPASEELKASVAKGSSYSRGERWD